MQQGYDVILVRRISHAVWHLAVNAGVGCIGEPMKAVGQNHRGCLGLRFRVVAFAKDGGAYTYHRTSFFHSQAVVVTHAHG